MRRFFGRAPGSPDTGAPAHRAAPAGMGPRATTERDLLLAGRIAAFEVARRERIRSLADIEFRVFSQFGEDGIIEWLCSRLPDIPRRFVEFGVETYEQANTRFVMANRGWRGLIIDSGDGHLAATRGPAWRHDLTAAVGFVTAENIDGLIRANGFAGEIGLLGVDIDGNDYWVLKAIESVRPWIIVCEMNAVFGDRHAITVPYRPDFDRQAAHFSRLYFGASVVALTELCAGKGYRFIGSASSGVNAFFVRDDVAGPVLSAIDVVRAWPSHHRESLDAEGRKTLIRGPARADVIAALPVVDVRTGATVPLGSLAPLYSEAWLADM